MDGEGRAPLRDFQTMSIGLLLEDGFEGPKPAWTRLESKATNCDGSKWTLVKQENISGNIDREAQEKAARDWGKSNERQIEG